MGAEAGDPDAADLLFRVRTPLGFCVRVTRAYWDLITTIKHPAMLDREQGVRRTLEAPDEVRRSRSDRDVYLFYRRERAGRWVCAVAKKPNGDAFLITAYPTDAVKEGVRIWPK